MDETTIAFEAPLMRAVATGGAEMLDRISVRDYVCEVEIGAFKAERGVNQRVRFNVVMEVSHHTAAQDDDVDKVISYDTITEGISTLLNSERINLLETLAERLAEVCLADRRAVRVFIRIEKLDRIPGALGVEIVRSRVPADAPHLVPVSMNKTVSEGIKPEVLFLSNQLIQSGALTDWIDAVISRNAACVICVPPVPGFAQTHTGEAARRITMLSIEQNCWQLVARDPRITVVDSRTELDWALNQKKLVVWAPQHIVSKAGPDQSHDPTSATDLAVFLARHLGAQHLGLVATSDVPVATDLVVQTYGIDEFTHLKG